MPSQLILVLSLLSFRVFACNAAHLAARETCYGPRGRTDIASNAFDACPVTEFPIDGYPCKYCVWDSPQGSYSGKSGYVGTGVCKTEKSQNSCVVTEIHYGGDDGTTLPDDGTPKGEGGDGSGGKGEGGEGNGGGGTDPSGSVEDGETFVSGASVLSGSASTSQDMPQPYSALDHWAPVIVGLLAANVIALLLLVLFYAWMSYRKWKEPKAKYGAVQVKDVDVFEPTRVYSYSDSFKDLP
ncbi:hypothetical protein DL96DRAFT_347435 [Flagelloscypha sp. PMI_526]|nr:hypothetical protein DL96DRAFT_347435 [Flagelloscypha sp. PMI_526]